MKPARDATGKRLKLSGAIALACGLSVLAAPAALAAPAWLAPISLSAPLRTAVHARVAMDSAGNEIVVWQRQNATGNTWNVQASTRSLGGAFSAPLDLSFDSTEPVVAMSPEGAAVVVWRHYENGLPANYSLQATFRSPGGAFSPPVDISKTPVSALPYQFEVAESATGDVVVAWTEIDVNSGVSPNPTMIRASVRPSGGSFTAPVRVSQPPPEEVEGETMEEKEKKDEERKRSAALPRVAIASNGDAVVVWQYFDGTSEVTQAAVRRAGKGFSSKPLPMSKPGKNATLPAVAMDAAGNATAVWSGLDETGLFIQASKLPAAGAVFSAPVNISPIGFVAKDPDISMGADGTAVAAWVRSDLPESVIQVATAPPGGSFSPPVDVSEPPAQAPDVGVSAAGGTVVAWQRNGLGNHSFIEAAKRQAGGTFSGPAVLSAAGQDAVAPDVAIAGSGDSTAVWSRSDGVKEIVQAAGYDGSPPELRNVSIPSTGTVGTPVHFSATPFDVWPIGAAIFDFGDGAGATGNAVAHSYSAPGTYPVTVTVKDSVGTPVSSGGAIAISARNDFTIGRLKLNRKLGTGVLSVSVPGPGAAVASGKGIRKARKRAARAGEVKIPIAAQGKGLERLNEQGKLRSLLKVAFSPDGGASASQQKRVTLFKKLG